MSTPQQILDACFAAFPFRLSLQVEGIEPVPSDELQSSTAFALAETSNEPEVPLILRRYQARVTRWRLFDDMIATREFAVLSALQDVGFPVPEPLTVTRRGNNPWLLTGRAPGETPTLATLPTLIPAWAAVLGSLHNYDSSILGDESLLPVRTLREVLGTYRSWSERADDMRLSEAATRLAALVDAEGGEEHRALLHGDWRPTNLLVQDGAITAITNWENSALGDPRWDVAQLANWLEAQGDEGQALIEPFISAYESGSRFPLGEMTLYRAITSLGQWAFAAWLRSAQERGDEVPLPDARPLIEHYETLARQTERLIERAEGL